MKSLFLLSISLIVFSCSDFKPKTQSGAEQTGYDGFMKFYQNFRNYYIAFPDVDGYVKIKYVILQRDQLYIECFVSQVTFQKKGLIEAITLNVSIDGTIEKNGTYLASINLRGNSLADRLPNDITYYSGNHSLQFNRDGTASEISESGRGFKYIKAIPVFER